MLCHRLTFTDQLVLDGLCRDSRRQVAGGRAAHPVADQQQDALVRQRDLRAATRIAQIAQPQIGYDEGVLVVGA